MAEGLVMFPLLAAVIGSALMAERLVGRNAAIALLGKTFPTGGILKYQHRPLHTGRAQNGTARHHRHGFHNKPKTIDPRAAAGRVLSA